MMNFDERLEIAATIARHIHDDAAQRNQITRTTQQIDNRILDYCDNPFSQPTATDILIIRRMIIESPFFNITD